MIALYARVSTRDKGQDTEVQLRRLREAAPPLRNRPDEPIREYVDEAGATDYRGRKAWAELLKAEPRIVLVVRLDRAFRSVGDAALTIADWLDAGTLFQCLDHPIDTTTAAGRMQINILVVFAEFERDLIRERILDGQALARENGKIIGRHPKGCQCPKHRGKH